MAKGVLTKEDRRLGLAIAMLLSAVKKTDQSAERAGATDERACVGKAKSAAARAALVFGERTGSGRNIFERVAREPNLCEGALASLLLEIVTAFSSAVSEESQPELFRIRSTDLVRRASALVRDWCRMHKVRLADLDLSLVKGGH